MQMRTWDLCLTPLTCIDFPICLRGDRTGVLAGRHVRGHRRSPAIARPVPLPVDWHRPRRRRRLCALHDLLLLRHVLDAKGRPPAVRSWRHHHILPSPFVLFRCCWVLACRATGWRAGFVTVDTTDTASSSSCLIPRGRRHLDPTLPLSWTEPVREHAETTFCLTTCLFISLAIAGVFAMTVPSIATRVPTGAGERKWAGWRKEGGGVIGGALMSFVPTIRNQ